MSPTSLDFNDSNWYRRRTITVTGDDDADHHDATATLSHQVTSSYSRTRSTTVLVDVEDDDEALILTGPPNSGTVWWGTLRVGGDPATSLVTNRDRARISLRHRLRLRGSTTHGRCDLPPAQRNAQRMDRDGRRRGAAQHDDPAPRRRCPPARRCMAHRARREFRKPALPLVPVARRHARHRLEPRRCDGDLARRSQRHNFARGTHRIVRNTDRRGYGARLGSRRRTTEDRPLWATSTKPRRNDERAVLVEHRRYRHKLYGRNADGRKAVHVPGASGKRQRQRCARKRVGETTRPQSRAERNAENRRKSRARGRTSRSTSWTSRMRTGSTTRSSSTSGSAAPEAARNGSRGPTPRLTA